MHLEFSHLQASYGDILRYVRDTGFVRTARGLPTYDLGFTNIVFHNTYEPMLPIATGRNAGIQVAAVEALQLIAGEMHPELLVKASPRFKRYMEPDGHFWGGYGERVGDQIVSAINKLNDDSESRQSVVTLWDPERDNDSGKLDYPCTLGFGFTHTGSRLNMNTVMRSNDAWLGFPNDVFVFTQLQHTIAYILGIDSGSYFHTAWSFHLYSQDVEKVSNVVVPHSEPYQPRGIPANSWSEAQRLARGLLRGKRYCADETPCADWLKWYVNALAPLMG